MFCPIRNTDMLDLRFRVLGRVYISFAFPRCAQMPVFSRCCEICLLKRRQENGRREMEETQRSLLLVGLSGRERKKEIDLRYLRSYTKIKLLI